MDIVQRIEPIWKENYSAIAMASSDEYLPYLCVCLQSLIDNASKNHNYDIVVFSSGKDEEKKKIIIDTYSSENVSIRFYNPSHHFDGIKLYISADYFNEACYYRIIVPEVMPNYEKVIFTDIDLIFNADIKELFELSIQEAPIAACTEPIWQYNFENNREAELIYSKEILKLKDCTKYLNTGVLVINIQNFIKNSYTKYLKEIIQNNKLLYQEQCAINMLLNSKAKILQPDWNVEISKETKNSYKKIKNKKIIHWVGREKPWSHPTRLYAKEWWKYARKTPFYHEFKNKNTGILEKLKTIIRSI